MSLLIQESSYVGDYTPAKTVRFAFNATDATGVLTAITSPVVKIYKDANTTESTAGVTLNSTYDSLTGLYLLEVDTSADGTFYSAGSDFHAVLTSGSVGIISVVGTVVGHFSLSNRSALRPTTADRTLDVSSGGEGGVDWANVGSPTTTLNLSGTTVGTANTVGSTGISAVATGLLDLADGVETSVTVRKALRAMAAQLCGNGTNLGANYAAIGNSGTPRLVVANPTTVTRTVTLSLT